MEERRPTTLDAAQFCTRHTDPQSVGDMEMRQKLELAQAIGYGIAELYEYLPTIKRIGLATVPICAPYEVELQMTNGSNEFTGHEFEAKWSGCTIEFQGVVFRNEIATPTSMMDIWRKPSGTYRAKVYHDAFGFGHAIRRITDEPVLYDENGEWQGSLCRVDSDEAPEAQFFSLEGFAGRRYRNRWYRYWDYGCPTHYAIYKTGNVQLADCEWILKIHPSPRAAMSLKMSVDYEPGVPCWEALSNFPVDLPVTDVEFTNMLCPMIEKRLMASTMWNGSDTANAQITEAYQRAIQSATKSPGNRAPRPIKVRTRPRY